MVTGSAAATTPSGETARQRGLGQRRRRTADDISPCSQPNGEPQCCAAHTRQNLQEFVTATPGYGGVCHPIASDTFSNSFIELRSAAAVACRSRWLAGDPFDAGQLLCQNTRPLIFPDQTKNFSWQSRHEGGEAIRPANAAGAEGILPDLPLRYRHYAVTSVKISEV